MSLLKEALENVSIDFDEVKEGLEDFDRRMKNFEIVDEEYELFVDDAVQESVIKEFSEFRTKVNKTKLLSRK